LNCTIKDLMNELGVSRGTISKALNDKKGVGEELRKKIKKKAEELAYVPNPIARRLSIQKSNTVGVFLLNRDTMGLKENFGMRFLEGITEIAEKKEYDILFFTITKGFDEGKNYIQLCKERKVEGAIFIGIEEDDLNIKEMEKTKIPISIIDLTLQGENVFNITTDNQKGIELGMDYLLENGHKNIAFIKVDSYCEVAEIRFNEYIKIMKKNKIYNEKNIFEGDFSFESGNKISNEIKKLKERPTAIFCSNDQMALGLMKGLQKSGIKVPEEISIVGFDNIVAGEYSNPALTTIEQDAIKIGKEAFNGIFKKDKSKKVIKPKLIIRDSVKKLK